MKVFLLLTGILAGSASAALAQTVLPSGAVAPAGAVSPTTGVELTPGTVPGAQPVVAPNMRDAGSRRASHHDAEAPGMSHQDKKRLRKMARVKPAAAGKLKDPAN
ncbi:MAG: hypothetical protein ACRYG7_10735 [Janthinobacterium lividum]